MKLNNASLIVSHCYKRAASFISELIQGCRTKRARTWISFRGRLKS